MTGGTKIFIVIVLIVVFIGFYLVSQAAKPSTVAASKKASEPTANIWTVIGGVIDIFDKGPKDSIGTDVSGQFVDAKGYLVNKEGEYVNEDGIVLNMVELPIKYTELI